MTKETFRRLLEITKTIINEKKFKHSIRLVFSGGEPLLVLPDYLNILKEYTDIPQITYSIITNGTLINEELAGFMSDYDMSAKISLDHPFHSKPLIDGTNAAEKTLNGIKLFDKFGVHFGVNSVFDETWERKDIDELLDFLYSIKKMNVKGKLIERTMSITSSHSISDISLVSKIMDLYEYCIQGIIKRNLFKVILYGYRPDTSTWFCRFGKEYAAIDTELNILPCQLINYPIAKYDEQFTEWFQDKMNEKNFTRRLKPRCADCEILHICHGGCSAYAFEKNRDDKEKIACIIRRRLYSLMNKYDYQKRQVEYLMVAENFLN